MVIKLKNHDLYWNGTSWTAYKENAKVFRGKAALIGEFTIMEELLNTDSNNFETEEL